MGEVYRASDPKLNRDVAIKVLPAALARDADYLARFQREAQTLAALNHPNIATVFGLEDNAIVMELIEGAAIRGPMDVKDALAILRQIADALEAAHDKGIIHRDLKPGNVLLTPQGVVKVLDFGLAKGVDPSPPPGPDSPTLTMRATEAGLILGTAGYMSPEQAAGKPVDRRADIWAFGVVLYELVTGKRMFDGETVSHTIASVLRDEIKLDAIPDGPARAIAARCLQRDLRSRLAHIGEARYMIENPPAPVAQRVTSSRLPWVIAATAVIAASVGWWQASRPPIEKPVTRWTIDLGADITLAEAAGGGSPRNAPAVVIAPDESRIAFVHLDKAGQTHLYLRRLDQPTGRRLEGTEGTVGPFFSPDSQWVGFLASGKLRKINVDGGPGMDICPAESLLGASWAGDGTIIASLSGRAQLSRVRDSGGTPATLTKLEGDETSHRWPQVLPGAKAVLFAAASPGAFGNATVIAQRLDSGERKVLVTGASFPRVIGGRYLTYFREGKLYAAGFDPERLAVKGDEVAIYQDAKFTPDNGGAQLDVTASGTLIYRLTTGQTDGSNVGWMDQSGNVRAEVPEMTNLLAPAVSLDRMRFAFRHNVPGGSEIWVKDFVGGQLRRLTFEPGVHDSPVWTPDGTRVAHWTSKGIFWTRADGSDAAVRLADGTRRASWFTPDGKKLAYSSVGQGSRGCVLVSISGDPDRPTVGAPEPCFRPDTLPESVLHATTQISPDGRWLAAGVPGIAGAELFVISFPDRGGRWQISKVGGALPRWSPDGKRLYFMNPEGRVMFSEVDTRGRNLGDAPAELVGKFGAGLDVETNTVLHSHGGRETDFYFVRSEAGAEQWRATAACAEL